MSKVNGVYTKVVMREKVRYKDKLTSEMGENPNESNMKFSTQLKKQLTDGIVQFTISCQDIKIKLPDNFDQEVDSMLNSITNTLPGVTGQPTTGTIRNPTIAFDYINNHIGNELQRINSEENVNAIRKTWMQILLEKIFNLLIISITPFLLQLLNQINTENPTLNLTIIGIISSPLELKNLEKSLLMLVLKTI